MQVLFHMVELCSDVDPRDKKGLTPLMHSIRANCSSATKYLLQRGADPNVCDNQGNSPLLMAVQENNLNICCSLMSSGANPNTPVTDRRITPLHIAIQK